MIAMEQLWDLCQTPREMLRMVLDRPQQAASANIKNPKRPSDRKLRLIVCWYYRKYLLPGTHAKSYYRKKVHQAEAMADGALRGCEDENVCLLKKDAARACLGIAPFAYAPRMMAGIRDVLGNPFAPRGKLADVTHSSWVEAVRLAKAAYSARNKSGSLARPRLQVLSDALEEAGCEDEALLAHLRATTLEHYRGCWAVDLVLGKE